MILKLLPLKEASLPRYCGRFLACYLSHSLNSSRPHNSSLKNLSWRNTPFNPFEWSDGKGYSGSRLRLLECPSCTPSSEFVIPQREDTLISPSVLINYSPVQKSGELLLLSCSQLGL